MAKKTNKTIKKPILILCEGVDAENFLIMLLNSKALSYNPFFGENIQVMDYGGNDELESKLLAIRNMEGFDNVKTLLIIRDAEKSVNKAQNQIREALEGANMTFPSKPAYITDGGNGVKTGYVLWPVCSENPSDGTLEDLCCNILKDEIEENKLLDCETFLYDMSRKHNENYSRMHKNKLHAYFSVTNKLVGMKIGEAAKAGAFNWKSEKLKSLIDFIAKAEI